MRTEKKGVDWKSRHYQQHLVMAHDPFHLYQSCIGVSSPAELLNWRSWELAEIVSTRPSSWQEQANDLLVLVVGEVLVQGFRAPLWDIRTQQWPHGNKVFSDSPCSFGWCGRSWRLWCPSRRIVGSVNGVILNITRWRGPNTWLQSGSGLCWCIGMFSK